MSAQGKIVSPSASLTFSGSSGIDAKSVGQVSVSYMVGAPASCSIKMHPKAGKNALVKVLTTDMANELGKIQSAAFSVRSSPDTSVVINDGIGNTLTFPGYIATPGFTHLPGAVDRGATLVHQTGMWDGFNTSIYQWGMDAYASMEQADGGTSWASLILFSINTLIQYGMANWQSDTASDTDKALRSQVHATNLTLLPGIREMLTNSIATTSSDSLKSVASDPSAGQSVLNSIVSTMINYMLTSRGGFWDILTQICSSFQLVYIPRPSGYGILSTLTQAVVGSPKTLEMGMTGAEYESASGRRLPLQQVFLQMASTSYAPQTQSSASGDPVTTLIAGWPSNTTQVTGSIMETPLPGWLSMSQRMMDPRPDAPSLGETVNSPGEGEAVDFSDFNTKAAKTITYFQLADKARIALSTEYTRNIYNDTCLAQSVFRLYRPLDVRWQAGQRYTVTSGGNAIFTGFLAGVTHTMSISNQGAASTSLTFTHVTIGQFKLPGA